MKTWAVLRAITTQKQALPLRTPGFITGYERHWWPSEGVVFRPLISRASVRVNQDGSQNPYAIPGSKHIELTRSLEQYPFMKLPQYGKQLDRSNEQACKSSRGGMRCQILCRCNPGNIKRNNTDSNPPCWDLHSLRFSDQLVIPVPVAFWQS